MKETLRKFQALRELIADTIQQNTQVAMNLRNWAPKLSSGQQEILIAAEHLDNALALLRNAKERFTDSFAALSTKDIDRIAARAASLMPDDPQSHYHCSEAFTIAVGEHFFGSIDSRTKRMTTGFAGGTGGTHEEMCGALFGGILIIGGIYGRALPYESDEVCYQKSALYRQEFLDTFGGTSCQSIKDTGYGSQGIFPCSVFVEKAVKLFLKTLLND